MPTNLSGLWRQYEEQIKGFLASLLQPLGGALQESVGKLLPELGLHAGPVEFGIVVATDDVNEISLV